MKLASPVRRGAMMIDVMSSTDVPTAQPRRLTRSRDDRIIGGVCSGAARYFDIDPIIPRIVLAVLAVFGGTGLAVYLLAWILIPEDGAPSTRFERWLEGRGGDREEVVLACSQRPLLTGATDGDPLCFAAPAPRRGRGRCRRDRGSAP